MLLGPLHDDEQFKEFLEANKAIKSKDNIWKNDISLGVTPDANKKDEKETKEGAKPRKTDAEIVKPKVETETKVQEPEVKTDEVENKKIQRLKKKQRKKKRKKKEILRTVDYSLETCRILVKKKNWKSFFSLTVL